MLETLKSEVCRANLELQKHGLVIYSWGNVSGIDRDKGIIAIKPSGVSYDELTADMIVLVDLDGNVVEGRLNPSSDTATHLALYRNFTQIGGICHTHSTNATVWAQAMRPIPCFGTTHADYFYGQVPVTRLMTAEEIDSDYEFNTGKVIIETFDKLSIKPSEMPAVLVAAHGPFTWGKNAAGAVEAAVVLEQTAQMALSTALLNPSADNIPAVLLNKHYLRKHGKNAYYGQTKQKGSDI